MNTPSPGETLARLAAEIALGKQAQRPLLLDLREVGGFADYFLLLSAMNGRHATSLAEEIRTSVRSQLGLRPLGIDGLETQSWVFMDYGSLFVHILEDSARERFALEQLWSKATPLPLDGTSVTP